MTARRQIEWLSERAVRCRGACRTLLFGCLLPDVVRCDWGGESCRRRMLRRRTFRAIPPRRRAVRRQLPLPSRSRRALLFGRTPSHVVQDADSISTGGRYPFVRIVGLPLLPLCTLLLIRRPFSRSREMIMATQIKTVISMTFPPYKFRFTLSMPFILRRFSRTTLRLSAFLT